MAVIRRECQNCGEDCGHAVKIEALEIIAGGNENTMRQWEGEAKRLRNQLAGAVEERDELRREVAKLRARLHDREDECQRWAMRWATDDRSTGGQ
jgi:regulator of replication initiation timing